MNVGVVIALRLFHVDAIAVDIAIYVCVCVSSVFAYIYKCMYLL